MNKTSGEWTDTPFALTFLYLRTLDIYRWQSERKTIMGVVIPFHKPRQKTWHDALTREQLARVARSKVEQEDPWLDFFTFEEERWLEGEIEADLIVLRCLRLIGCEAVNFA